MYGTPSWSSRRVKRRKRLGSGIEKGLANGAADRLVGPIRVLGSKGSRLQLARGVVKPLGGLEFLSGDMARRIRWAAVLILNVDDLTGRLGLIQCPRVHFNDSSSRPR